MHKRILVSCSIAIVSKMSACHFFDTVEQQLNNKLNEEDIFAENGKIIQKSLRYIIIQFSRINVSIILDHFIVRDDEKDTSNGMDRVLEQFTKLIQGFADSESEEPASLAADEEPETDAEGKGICKSLVNLL